MATTLQIWGNSPGIRVPKVIAKPLDLKSRTDGATGGDLTHKRFAAIEED
jgi:hypothetical protein